MAYQYLLSLHDIIDQRLNDIQAFMDKAKDQPETIEFLQGRSHALSELKQFLTANLNAKLPRKIRQQLKARRIDSN